MRERHVVSLILSHLFFEPFS